MSDPHAPDQDVFRQVGSSCACLRLQRAARAVSRAYDKAFRSLHLNNWQFSILTAIGAAELPSVNELAEMLGHDHTTMTRNLRVLQRRNLLEITPDAKDGRIKRASLTPEGRELLLAAVDRWRVTNEAVMATIPPASFPAVWKALGSIGQT